MVRPSIASGKTADWNPFDATIQVPETRPAAQPMMSAHGLSQRIKPNDHGGDGLADPDAAEELQLDCVLEG